MAQVTFLEGPVINSIGAKNAAIEFAGPPNSIAAFSARFGPSSVAVGRRRCGVVGGPRTGYSKCHFCLWRFCASSDPLALFDTSLVHTHDATPSYITTVHIAQS